jgi:lysophospholipase L1-like esterase
MGIASRLRAPHVPDAAGDHHGLVAGDGPALRLLLLGDSVVAGVGARDHEEGLAGQLARAITGLTGRSVSWRVVARSSATVRMIRSELVGRLPDPATPWQPDLVLVVAGVNDIIRLRPAMVFRRDVEQLVAAIRDQVGVPVPVLLCGIPPIHRVPLLPKLLRYGLAAHAWRLDRQLTALARRDPAVFHLAVWHHPVPLDGMFAIDRFHPGPTGYRTWGRVLGWQIATLVEGGLATTPPPEHQPTPHPTGALPEPLPATAR